MDSNYKINSVSLKVSLARSAGYGFIGFTMFLLLISLLKYVQIIFGITTIFFLDIYDVLISATGFIMMFLISFLKNFEMVGKLNAPVEKAMDNKIIF